MLIILVLPVDVRIVLFVHGGALGGLLVPWVHGPSA